MTSTAPAPDPGATFTGFPEAGLRFLAELKARNRRDWFEQHRAEYEALLLQPARALVVELTPRLQRLAPGLRAEPRVGGSILRLHRDARFARGALFRDHMELWFWEGDGPSAVHPGFFVTLSPSSFAVGAGLRNLPAGTLPGYRRAVDDPEAGVELDRLLHRLERTGWAMEGRLLRLVPRPYPRDHPRATLLRRTGLWAEARREPPDDVFQPALVRLLERRFRALLPLHRWLVGLS
jgi:uncharacterized protein (TIGR02453 family)